MYYRMVYYYTRVQERNIVHWIWYKIVLFLIKLSPLLDAIIINDQSISLYWNKIYVLFELVNCLCRNWICFICVARIRTKLKNAVCAERYFNNNIIVSLSGFRPQFSDCGWLYNFISVFFLCRNKNLVSAFSIKYFQHWPSKPSPIYSVKIKLFSTNLHIGLNKQELHF